MNITFTTLTLHDLMSYPDNMLSLNSQGLVAVTGYNDARRRPDKTTGASEVADALITASQVARIIGVPLVQEQLDQKQDRLMNRILKKQKEHSNERDNT